MNKELEDYYIERFKMFETKGWKDLMEDLQKAADATNRLDGVTVDTLTFKQGEMSVLRWMLSLKDLSEAVFDELTTPKDEPEE